MDWSLFRFVNVVDLTQPLFEGMPVFPGDPEVSRTPLPESPEYPGVRGMLLSFSDHAGTHLDAPAHLLEDGLTVDRIAAPDLIRPALMIDVREECLDDDDHRIGLQPLEAWEKRHGWVPPGSIVLFQTGWSFRFGDRDRYLPRDEGGTLHTPGISGDLAVFLAEERQVQGVGIDAPSIDVGRSTSLPAHRALLAGGCYLLENLTNLHGLPEVDFQVIVAPLKLRGCTGSPCRVLALVPKPL